MSMSQLTISVFYAVKIYHVPRLKTSMNSALFMFFAYLTNDCIFQIVYVLSYQVPYYLICHTLFKIDESLARVSSSLNYNTVVVHDYLSPNEVSASNTGIGHRMTFNSVQSKYKLNRSHDDTLLNNLNGKTLGKSQRLFN